MKNKTSKANVKSLNALIEKLEINYICMQHYIKGLREAYFMLTEAKQIDMLDSIMALDLSRSKKNKDVHH